MPPEFFSLSVTFKRHLFRSSLPLSTQTVSISDHLRILVCCSRCDPTLKRAHATLHMNVQDIPLSASMSASHKAKIYGNGCHSLGLEQFFTVPGRPCSCMMVVALCGKWMSLSFSFRLTGACRVVVCLALSGTDFCRCLVLYFSVFSTSRSCLQVFIFVMCTGFTCRAGHDSNPVGRRPELWA